MWVATSMMRLGRWRVPVAALLLMTLCSFLLHLLTGGGKDEFWLVVDRIVLFDLLVFALAWIPAAGLASRLHRSRLMEELHLAGIRTTSVPELLSSGLLPAWGTILVLHAWIDAGMFAAFLGLRRLGPEGAWLKGFSVSLVAYLAFSLLLAAFHVESVRLVNSTAMRLAVPSRGMGSGAWRIAAGMAARVLAVLAIGLLLSIATGILLAFATSWIWDRLNDVVWMVLCSIPGLLVCLRVKRSFSRSADLAAAVLLADNRAGALLEGEVADPAAAWHVRLSVAEDALRDAEETPGFSRRRLRVLRRQYEALLKRAVNAGCHPVRA